MPRYDIRTPRIYLDIPLVAGHAVPLGRDQANYLLNVLRLEQGDGVLLFNGRNGEWRAVLAGTGKKTLAAEVQDQAREQPRPADLHFLFAPLKHARLDYMVQKAVELGASRIQPVMTKHTQVSRLNLDRMRANAIEAAQQCGVLAVPEVVEAVPFKSIVGPSGADRLLVFCDEDAEVKDPVAALAAARPQPSALLPAGVADAPQPVAVLIGPEGGFAEEEREALLKRPNVVRISLGPRILRADTAAVAALTLVQAVLGDWTRE
ncbi:MAG: 16S rRNA (uracil(1498)-N(3))-methyltransferase [Pseudolabrys sp.]|nr:16S rRNA (uracil(1498)-N(3))-methyltransferase [Pseudolabrys sp.]MDP2297243.1 16S rRNA (uracil(1498)-N(3))-methyltransferase [Pseudolabrys sp.]